MKKSTRWIILLTLVSLLVFATGGIASADAPVKGDITGIDEGTGTVTVTTKTGDVTITLPAEFDITSVSLGDFLMAKGTWTSETEFTADWVKAFPPKTKEPEEEEEEEDNDDEGEKPEKEDKQFNSAYCTGEKETSHPLAEKLAAKFGESTGVTAEQVQAWYCEGNSIGQIMLALLTQKMDGTDAAEILADRNSGISWGKIWKLKGLIGSEKDGLPPGQLKKIDKKVPPGLLKKTPQP